MKCEKLTGMDQVHATHGAAGIVKHPLIRVVMSGVDVPRVFLSELRNNVVDDSAGIIAMGLDTALGEIV